MIPTAEEQRKVNSRAHLSRLTPVQYADTKRAAQRTITESSDNRELLAARWVLERMAEIEAIPTADDGEHAHDLAVGDRVKYRARAGRHDRAGHIAYGTVTEISGPHGQDIRIDGAVWRKDDHVTKAAG